MSSSSSSSTSSAELLASSKKTKGGPWQKKEKKTNQETPSEETSGDLGDIPSGMETSDGTIRSSFILMLKDFLFFSKH